MEKTDSFLGTGWSFPPAFERGSARVMMTAEEKDIEKSLEILLGTRPGERLMHPTFGCNLEEMVFENLDLTLKTYMTDLIETAILEHEPRVDLEKVAVVPGNETEGLVLIEIWYRVRSTNSRFNLVYPFYKNEGLNP